MQRSLEEEPPEPEEETQNAEPPKVSLLAANNNSNGNEIPPKPEGFEEPDKTIQDSQIEVDIPTAAPIMTDAPAPIEPPLKTPGPTEPYQRPDATITDLAEQELGNLLNGGPKPLEGEDATGDDNTAGDGDLEPSEMDIVVPETEAEEEEIDSEIEEWEEEHGKPKPGDPIDEQPAEEENIDDTPSAGDETNESTSTEEPEVPASSPTINPLIVTPSWTPPDIEPQHTLKPGPVPTEAPLPSPTEAFAPPPTRAPVRVPAPTSFSTPTGDSVVKQQEDVACQDYGPQTVAYMLCLYNIPPAAAPVVGVGIPLLIILCCCWRFCCGKSKKESNSRGEYRQIANTYGDANFDNAFSEDFSDEEDDMEDMAWGESNGRRVLEMKNMGRRRGDDDLSLEEMNG